MLKELGPYSQVDASRNPAAPMHWRRMRLKAVLRESDTRGFSEDFPLLSLTRSRGLILQSDASGKAPSAADLSNYKRCIPGQIVMNRMQAWAGMFASVSRAGTVSPDYAVFSILGANNAAFVEYLLKTPHYVSEFAVRSKGIGTGFNRLYSDQLGGVDCSLPSRAEQDAIVKYLRHAHARIDRAIAAKRKLIALLEEQKWAIINQAVTRGLDPSVPLKDSGISWLGEIPAHWEVRRAKELCISIVDCKNRTPDEVVDGRYTVVRTTCVRDGEFHEEGSYKTDQARFEEWTARGAPRLGDVFFTREAPMGEAALVPDRADLCMGQRMMYLRPDPSKLDANFLLHTIYGPVVRAYISIKGKGSTVGHLRLGQVADLPLLVAPVNEQQSIASHIASSVAPLEAAASRASREIELLREFRTRLTSDVVTGQVDVREIAASLPELGDDIIPRPGDEFEELLETELEQVGANA